MTLDEKMLIQILASYVEELKELDKRRETILKLKREVMLELKSLKEKDYLSEGKLEHLESNTRNNSSIS